MSICCWISRCSPKQKWLFFHPKHMVYVLLSYVNKPHCLFRHLNFSILLFVCVAWFVWLFVYLFMHRSPHFLALVWVGCCDDNRFFLNLGRKFHSFGFVLCFHCIFHSFCSIVWHYTRGTDNIYFGAFCKWKRAMKRSLKKESAHQALKKLSTVDMIQSNFSFAFKCWQ